MAFAPAALIGKVAGQFTEREFGKWFEYDALSDNPDYPHRVWVTTPREGIDSGWRHARVLKTVAHIVIDEDENGLVVEKWSIRRHSLYRR
jgi:hypothetical protein